jgi:hypothetical protein
LPFITFGYYYCVAAASFFTAASLYLVAVGAVVASFFLASTLISSFFSLSFNSFSFVAGNLASGCTFLSSFFSSFLSSFGAFVVPTFGVAPVGFLASTAFLSAATVYVIPPAFSRSLRLFAIGSSSSPSSFPPFLPTDVPDLAITG